MMFVVMRAGNAYVVSLRGVVSWGGQSQMVNIREFSLKEPVHILIGMKSQRLN